MSGTHMFDFTLSNSHTVPLHSLYPEDGNIRYLRNLPVYAASKLRRGKEVTVLYAELIK
jgi:hypothetical protein